MISRPATTSLYVTSNYTCGMLTWWYRHVFLFLFMMLASAPLFAQAEYDELLVNLDIKRLSNLQVGIIIKGEQAYLPVCELFDTLKIKNTHSPGFDSISGYFMDPKSAFLIDAKERKAIYNGNLFNLGENGLILTSNGLYLQARFFGQIFGLDCAFDIRNLSITLSSKVELPVIREMEQDRMRRNMNVLKGERKADTLIRNEFSWFRVGTADWSLSTIQQSKNSNSRLNLGLGGKLAGGDFNVNLNYNSYQPLAAEQQFYNWRYVNNNNAGLRQVTLGRIFVPSLSTIFAPMTGIQVTNTPTTYRKSFGTYRISNTTEPGWMVELYINNTLVNYVRADAAGFYTFDVPLVFGNSVVKLRFYGPYGEVQIKEQFMNIPFNFLPLHQFEYTVTAGIISDNLRSRFSRTNINYGLTKKVTVGTGVEYLSSVSRGRPMPFMNASARLGSSLILSGEFAPGVRTNGTLSYHHPSNLQLDLNYFKYDKDQTAVRFSYREERKASLSMPFRGKHYSAFARLTYNSFVMPKSGFNTFDFLFSSTIHGVNSSLLTTALYTDPEHPLVYSNLSFNLRLPAGIILRPMVEYQYEQKKFTRIRAEAEKRVFRQGFATIAYENTLLYKIQLTTVGLRYDFSFAQAALLVRRTGKVTSLLQSARGSIVYNSKARFVDLDNQSKLHTGGLIFLPFLDLNGNGKKDASEPTAPGLKLLANGRKVERREKDSSLYMMGLEAYTNQFVELDKDSYEEISWRIKHLSMNVSIAPNQVRIIEVPVLVVGEASGTVVLDQKGSKTGLARVIVNFYNSAMVQVGRTISEEDGYFSYLGFAPGTYTASIDSAQLVTLKMSSAPSNLTFNIKVGVQGDIVDKLEFVVAPIAE